MKFPADAIVIIDEHVKSDIADIPAKFGLEIKLDIICLPKNEEFGTADSIRFIQDKIKVIDNFCITKVCVS